ncbi:isoprenylcysteine carboxylmethyltransferase family protein [Salegentibacter sp. JZCK2]|uniref:methyltransferase family protein n=1 Tax=Salegentibacter tibetensis TaxID=2873600 RepID=UPI001CCBDADF|nr:isoprenylcysteine carboxylmethyltransferase family protein [Salegentibacter tibetensis]MBZ9731559.1 isoprenylcysteine carboxylmethyltransferase family protein [Salegentibacter tibetensis]
MPFKNYFFVGMQLLLFIAWVINIEALEFNRLEFFQPVFLVLSGVGFLIVLISILQLNTNLSPFPKPKENACLITSGLFKYIRHPIYSGILIFLFFLSLYFASGYKIGITVLLLILFWFKSEYEEEQLCLKYAKYRDYRQGTGRFFPKFTR